MENGDRGWNHDGGPGDALASAARWLLPWLIAVFLAPLPGSGQVLDAAWQGREQAANFFHDSIEKERAPPDWAGSIKALEKSVELSPEPSWEASLVDGSGRWRRHYVPYYYLGLAHWGLGDCSTAVETLSTSLAKGEVCRCKQGERKNLEKVLTKCEQRGVPSAQPARDLVRSECSKVVVAQPLDEADGSERLAGDLFWGVAADLLPEIGPR